MSNPRAGWLGAILILAAAGLFGALGVLSRFAYAEGMEPFAFVSWRAGVGAIGLWLAISVLRARSGRAEATREREPNALRWLLLAVLLGAGLNLAAFLSFDNTTVALALLGFYTYPAMVAAGSVLLGREPLDSTRVLALGLALAGMLAVVLGGPATDGEGRNNLVGVALALVAAGCQTAFVLTSRGYASISADRAIGTILVGSAAVSIVVTLAVHGPAALTLPFGSPGLIGLLLFTGLFAAALPSVMFLTGIRWLGGVRAGILMLFEPVVGVALAAAFLAEGLQPLQVLGGATILAAAVIVQRGARVASETGSPAIAPAPGGP
jgi:drug/metabolite transporter, DME family